MRSCRRERRRRPRRDRGRNPDFTPANVFRIAEQTGGEVLRADKAGVRFQEMLEHIRVRYSLGIKAALAAGRDVPPSGGGVVSRGEEEIPEGGGAGPRGIFHRGGVTPIC